MKIMSKKAEQSIMESIRIDYMMMKKCSWNINEYLTALKAYLMAKQRVTIPFESSQYTINKLVEQEYLTIDKEDFSTTDKLVELFEDKKEFLKLYELYPHKVMDKYGRERILKAKDPDSIVGNKLFKKWVKLTKGNQNVIENMLKGLNNELSHRKKNASMEYMQMLETWLNGGTWESYLEEETENNNEVSDKIV